MTQQYGRGLTPQQQKQFSSWWLDQQYGGDLNNVAGLTQNENGYWQGEPGRKYDINPETGQKGTFQFLSGSGAPGWLDVTPEKYGEYSNIGGGQVKMIRNRHGLYTPESAYGHDGNFSRQYQFTTNPNTGEEGKWIFLGQMGWVNIEGDPQPEPEEGQIVFGGGGQIAGPYDPDYDGSVKDASSDTDIDNDSSSTIESTDTSLNSSGMMSGGNSSRGSSFSPSTPMGLNYAAPQAMQIAQTPKVDYAKVLNNLLIADVFGGMMTGKKV
jgi:hypothetical protein